MMRDMATYAVSSAARPLYPVHQVQRHGFAWPLCVLLACCLVSGNTALAGGGVVMTDNQCTMHIDFYSARFTAYQPDTRANEEFCEDLPDTGLTLFVLDYLHPSLKQVPVDFRIIRDITGQGRFAKWEDVAALGDIEPLTEFYHPPEIRPDGSFQLEFTFTEEGRYIGVVTAGHPTSDAIYTSVFPFQVGRKNVTGWWLLAAVLAGVAAYTWHRRRGHGPSPP